MILSEGVIAFAEALVVEDWAGGLWTNLKQKNLLIPAAARVFSLDSSFGLLATVSASALALFFGSALSSFGVRCV